MTLPTGTVVVFKEKCFASSPGRNTDGLVFDDYIIEKNATGLITTSEGPDTYTVVVNEVLVQINNLHLEDYVWVCNSLEELNKHEHNGSLKRQTRKLKAKWSIEVADDLKAFYSVDNLSSITHQRKGTQKNL